MHLSRHPTSYPTRWQEIAAKLEVELRTHYRCGITCLPNSSLPTAMK
jgi:hypothetical protein